MHHTQKKKFLSMKDSGATQEEIQSEMAGVGIEAAEIEVFLAEIFAPDGEPKEGKEGTKKTSSKNTPKTGGAGHPIYEEWKMAINNESGSPVLEKFKKVKDVKMDHVRAARLNEQASNRRVQYFLKEN